MNSEYLKTFYAYCSGNVSPNTPSSISDLISAIALSADAPEKGGGVIVIAFMKQTEFEPIDVETIERLQLTKKT